MQSLVVTTSWDDGHPADSRLAEMLAKYDMPATFYVPCQNIEGRPVLDTPALRAISERYEIGGHTLDHVELTSISSGEMLRQVCDGKTELEQRTGKELIGFAYPMGGHNRRVREAVESAKFRYGRSITNLRITSPRSPYEMPTSLQFYPHPADVYIRNFVRFGYWNNRLEPLLNILSSRRLSDRVLGLARLSLEKGYYFHLWGHSWEIERDNLWGELELTFQHMNTIFHSALKRDNAGTVEHLEHLNLMERDTGRPDDSVTGASAMTAE